MAAPDAGRKSGNSARRRTRISLPRSTGQGPACALPQTGRIPCTTTSKSDSWRPGSLQQYGLPATRPCEEKGVSATHPVLCLGAALARNSHRQIVEKPDSTRAGPALRMDEGTLGGAQTIQKRYGRATRPTQCSACHISRCIVPKGRGANGQKRFVHRKA
jgi:hypothetical protein